MRKESDKSSEGQRGKMANSYQNKTRSRTKKKPGRQSEYTHVGDSEASKGTHLGRRTKIPEETTNEISRFYKSV